MKTKLQKWGNSSGIRIPKNILDDLNIKTNDILDLIQIEDKIIIIKPKKEKISLKERFSKYKGPNIAKDFLWDENKGKEIW